jgi:hypothetical protein
MADTPDVEILVAVVCKLRSRGDLRRRRVNVGHRKWRLLDHGRLQPESDNRAECKETKNTHQKNDNVYVWNRLNRIRGTSQKKPAKAVDADAKGVQRRLLPG